MDFKNKKQKQNKTDFLLPEYISIIDSRIRVVVEKHMRKNYNVLGQSRFDADQIALQDPAEGESISTHRLVQIFFHEIVHWILHKIGEDDLNNNEAFVDLLASCWLQVLQSAGWVPCLDGSPDELFLNTEPNAVLA